MLRSLLIIILLLQCFHAHAQEFGIVATVNGTAITSLDIENRMKYMQKTEKAGKNNLKDVALKAIITDILKKGDAAEQEIDVTQEEMQLAFEELEQKNGIKSGYLEPAMKAKGVSFDIMREQVKIQILWQKIMGRNVRPKVSVSDAEIEEGAKKIASANYGGDVNISEFVARLDKEGVNIINYVVEQLGRGASFEELTRNYSIGSTAANGGQMGWIKETQMGQKMQEILRAKAPGSVIGPIKGDDSIRIIKINSRNTGAVDTSNVDREKVKIMLVLKKIEVESRKYLNDLRKKAFIEIKQ
jgi:peptidyl-prolyl cis-trans isomerase SurA